MKEKHYVFSQDGEFYYDEFATTITEAEELGRKTLDLDPDDTIFIGEKVDVESKLIAPDAEWFIEQLVEFSNEEYFGEWSEDWVVRINESDARDLINQDLKMILEKLISNYPLRFFTVENSKEY